MNDQQAQAVLRLVDDFLDGDGGRGIDVGPRAHFEGLVAHVYRSLGGTDALDDDDLRIIVAMCWLGPRTGIPPESQRSELLRIMRSVVPDADTRCKRVMEFVIAYGCGKWRQVVYAGPPWQQPWAGAIQGLARALEPSVREANRWLRSRIAGYPDRDKDAVWEDASLLTICLYNPEEQIKLDEALSISSNEDGAELTSPNYSQSVPNGAKAVFTVKNREVGLRLPKPRFTSLTPDTKLVILARDDETRISATIDDSTVRARLRFWESGELQVPAVLGSWACSCGHSRCDERHRLERWNPDDVTLWAFAASAVKGPQLSIKMGSFIAGMYFPLLAKGASGPRLRVANVEYKVCLGCSKFGPVGPIEGVPIDDVSQVSVGDFVVHRRYGCGIFAGIASLAIDEVEGNYLSVDYPNGSRIYSPIENGGELLRWVGADQPNSAAPSTTGIVEYEGACRIPDHLFNPTETLRVTHERLILIGSNTPGSEQYYLPRTRLRCKNRAGHYAILTGFTPAEPLGERWENLIKLSGDLTYENIRDAHRALADDEYLRSKLDDVPDYLRIGPNVVDLDARVLRDRFRQWLKDAFNTRCPLCDGSPTAGFNTIWKRSFGSRPSTRQKRRAAEKTQEDTIDWFDGKQDEQEMIEDEQQHSQETDNQRR